MGQAMRFCSHLKDAHLPLSEAEVLQCLVLSDYLVAETPKRRSPLIYT